MSNQGIEDAQLAYALARENFGSFILLMDSTYELAYHHEQYVKQLMRVDAGIDRRVIVQSPPRHGKSRTTSELFPAWYLGRHPERKVISASCTQDLANDFGSKVRNILLDPRFQAIFPECRLSADMQAKDHFRTTAGGEYFAVGRGSTTVGRGANLLLVDDPTRDKIEARSEGVQREMYDWFSTVARTRLEPPNAIVVIETLWSEAGLSAWLPRTMPKSNWKILRFSAIADTDEYDELGNLWRRKGEALWPDRIPLEELEEIRDGMRSDDWNCLYQQKATDDAGNYFKTEWLERSYLDKPSSGEGMNRYILVDPATSKKRGSDFTAMWVVGLGADRNYYPLAAVRDKLSLSERADLLFKLHADWFPIINVGYEEYALSGDIPYIRERMDRMNYNFTITPLGGGIRKEERIKELEPLFRTGRIRMPRYLNYRTILGETNDLLKPFLEEYRSFPNAAHDDMLDSLARITDKAFTLDWPMTTQQIERRAQIARNASGKGSWMAA